MVLNWIGFRFLFRILPIKIELLSNATTIDSALNYIRYKQQEQQQDNLKSWYAQSKKDLDSPDDSNGNDDGNEELTTIRSSRNRRDIYLANHPPPIVDWQLPLLLKQSDGAKINWIYFRAQALDKYRNNEHCDIGHDDQNECEYTRFLSIDKIKPPDSAVRFRFANIQDQDILLIKTSDYITYHQDLLYKDCQSDYSQSYMTTNIQSKVKSVWRVARTTQDHTHA